MYGQVSATVVKSTVTCKQVGDLEILANVIRPNDGIRSPAVMWIHGGALMKANREKLVRSAQALLQAGYVVVSIDYRPAPETKLPEIIEDVEDAYHWIRANGRHLFQANTTRIGVVGESAGGFLALTAGYRLTPPPSVLFSVFGFGDLVGAWATGQARILNTTPPRSGQTKLRLWPRVPLSRTRETATGTLGLFTIPAARTDSGPSFQLASFLWGL